MNTLVVIGNKDVDQAEEVRLKLRKLHRDYLIDLDDAVVAVKDAAGKIKLHQAVNLTAAGAVSGSLTDVGINDNFMKELAAALTPGSSALFVLVRKMTPDKVLKELQGTGGTVLQTSLADDDERSFRRREARRKLKRWYSTINAA